MLQLTLTLHLDIEGPFITKSSGVGGYGVDAVLLRDRTGSPLLPGTQVRGRVRDALEELASAIGGSDGDALEQFVVKSFGPKVKVDSFEPEHGHRVAAMRFSDFTGDHATPNPVDTERLLTRIKLDPETGSACKGAMLTLETAAEPMQQTTFTGEVELFEADVDAVTTAAHHLFKALHWTASLGSFRTVGFGQLRAVRAANIRLKLLETDDVQIAKLADSLHQRIAELSDKMQCVEIIYTEPATRRSGTTGPSQFELRLDEPFIVGQRRTNRNVIRSVDYLNGAVIKGAIAAQLHRWLADGREVDSRTDVQTLGTGTRWELLCDHLSKIRFCTALPIRKNQSGRPVVAPLSLVKFDDQLRDVALVRGPCLLKTDADPSSPVAPAFSIDWKDAATPGWDSGRAWPVKELRFHTAIGPRYRRARQEHLFAHELVHPVDCDGQSLVWRGKVDLSRVPENVRDEVHVQLDEVFRFVELRIGKTKARATLSLMADSLLPSQVSSLASLAGKQWVIVLQSPAFLADPQTVRKSWDAGEANGLNDEYKRVFGELSDGKLRLVRFFADQSLHGGFLAQRTCRELKQPYNPLFVTDAGSVFVLKATGDESAAASRIEAWFAGGLPLPAWAATLYGTTYRTNPFLPEDGFGEIAVNLPLHESLRITEAEALYVD